MLDKNISRCDVINDHVVECVMTRERLVLHKGLHDTECFVVSGAFNGGHYAMLLPPTPDPHPFGRITIFV